MDGIRMRKRKRAAGILILALALASGFIALRPRPDLVPYTTPWLAGEDHEVRISLLVPAGWERSQISRSEFICLPQKPVGWMPRWLFVLLRPKVESRWTNYLVVDVDNHRRTWSAITANMRY